MQTSEQINEVTTAMIAAQKEFSTINKDAQNPFFKSAYAPLDTILKGVNPILVKNNLNIFTVHTPENVCETILVHTSGQWIKSSCKMINTKGDMQGMGAASTYGARYNIQRLLNIIVDNDDDGNSISVRTSGQVGTQASTYKPQVNQYNKISCTATQGCDGNMISSKYENAKTGLRVGDMYCMKCKGFTAI